MLSVSKNRSGDSECSVQQNVEDVVDLHHGTSFVNFDAFPFDTYIAFPYKKRQVKYEGRSFVLPK